MKQTILSKTAAGTKNTSGDIPGYKSVKIKRESVAASSA